jgi:hypothetical protein
MKKKLNEVFDTGSVAQRIGSFSVMTDHPGIDPKGNVKKKKTSKVDRSPFVKDEDARKNYIKGEMDASGFAKKINEKLNKLVNITKGDYNV